MKNAKLRSNFSDEEAKNKFVLKSGSIKTTLSKGVSRTTEQSEITMSFQQVKSVGSSVMVFDMLYSDLNALYNQLDPLLHERNKIFDNQLKRIIFKDRLKEIERKINNLEMKIYEKQTIKMNAFAKEAEKKLELYRPLLVGRKNPQG